MNATIERPSDDGQGAREPARAAPPESQSRTSTARRGAKVDIIEAGLLHLIAPGTVVELRVLKTQAKRGIVSGYFDDPRKLAQAAAELSGKAEGVYMTLNPVKPELLARAANRVQDFAKHTTSDGDILKYAWLLVDADPNRPAGISSSDAEHAAALAKVRAVRAALQDEGFPAPIMADSGNGGHLLYRVDLPSDRESIQLLQACLQSLQSRFGDAEVSIDETTYNPGRICKVYGTLACKGDPVAGRPHRVATILDTPGTITPVPRALLERLANSRTSKVLPGETPNAHTTLAEFDLGSWMTEHCPDADGPKPWENGQKWTFSVCPWNSEHTNDSAYVVQRAAGGIAAGCHHNSCQGHDWRALRKLRDPGGRSGVAASPSHKRSPSAELPHSDVGNAQRLARQYGERLKYCEQFGWMAYDGHRWKRDTTRQVERCAKDTVRSLHRAASELEDDDRRQALARWARTSESVQRIKAMIELAKSEPEIAVDASTFDADAFRLNCLNGTLDLRTATLHPHEPGDLITKLTPVRYDPAATAPTWEAFLRRVTGDNEELQHYLQRAAGYTATGSTEEQVMFFLYGSGRNGKSVFLGAIEHVLGDYAKPTRAETFMAKKGDGIPNDIADLAGARYVPTSETDQGRSLAEALVKQLTGGDTVTARFLHKEFFRFKPQFKIWLAANHKPVITGTDDAIWERIRLIPFTAYIPPDQRDKKLSEKLKAEAAGILTWLVSGFRAWQSGGLGDPLLVRDGTSAYREEMDVITRFLADCCIQDPNQRVGATKLYEAYCRWARDAAIQPIGQRPFGATLRDRGLAVRRSGQGGGTEYHGLCLASEMP